MFPRASIRADMLLSFIFLYGPPGSVKSAIAPRLAKSLCMPCLDLDDEIERRSGRRISEIFVHSGEEGFRLLEREMLQHALSGQPSVIALGGGSLLDPQCRQLAQSSGSIICLSAPWRYSAAI
jgi:shikimate kinase